MRAFLAVLFMALLIVLLITPHALVILFPEDAEWLSAVTSATFPWTILLMLFLIFYDGIISFLGNLKEVSAAGITAKVGQTGATLSDADVTRLSQHLDVTRLSQHLDELTKGQEASQQLARTYFLRFIAVSIYRSQYEFLADLVNNGPGGRVIALEAYTNFTSRKPKRLKATFDEWMAFLTANSLVFVTEANNYKVTSEGKLFVEVVRAAGLDASNFTY